MNHIEGVYYDLSKYEEEIAELVESNPSTMVLQAFEVLMEKTTQQACSLVSVTCERYSVLHGVELINHPNIIVEYHTMYRRTGFICGNLLIVNYKFLLCSQLLESQSYPIFSKPHEPREKQMQSINL